MKLSDLAEYQGDRPLKTLFHLYRQDLGYLGLSLLLYVIKHSPEWLRPLVIANVIDIISAPSTHSLGELWFNGALLIFAVGQNIPTHYWHIHFMSLATRKVESSLRLALAQRLQELSISFYHRNSTGALQAKLLKDVEAIQILTSQLVQFLLDEATSSLDSEAEFLIQEALERLMFQWTTFVVAHRLSTIRSANRIIVLEKGKILTLSHRPSGTE